MFLGRSPQECSGVARTLSQGSTASVFMKADRNYINFYVNKINWKTDQTRYTTAFYATEMLYTQVYRFNGASTVMVTKTILSQYF